MASCCSSSNSSAPKKKLIIAVVTLVIVVIAAVCMLNLNKQKPQAPAKQDATQSVSDTNADAAADAAKKNEAKQKAEKAAEKTNSIADEQYANILKDASSYLKNNQRLHTISISLRMLTRTRSKTSSSSEATTRIRQHRVQLLCYFQAEIKTVCLGQRCNLRFPTAKTRLHSSSTAKRTTRCSTS